MPACIIPLGPEWQDPPGERNQKPIVLSVTPEIGSRGTNTTFTILLSDADDKDLWVRWFIDFPPMMPTTPYIAFPDPRSASAPGTPVLFPKEMTCLQIPAGPPTHRIMAAISDRPFIEEDGVDPRSTTDGIAPLQLVWILDKTCQAGP